MDIAIRTYKKDILKKNVISFEGNIHFLLKKNYNPTHNFVAVPSVAGHPTGGAVDATIVDAQGKELDMGTKIGDFSDPEKIKTFSKKISKKQLKNRLLLHEVMVKEGFAPFYGEWWHFSYGDREWACFYGKKRSIYSPIEFKIKKPS
jgi:D-alanyl-D-alanine dipeptidase